MVDGGLGVAAAVAICAKFFERSKFTLRHSNSYDQEVEKNLKTEERFKKIPPEDVDYFEAEEYNLLHSKSLEDLTTYRNAQAEYKEKEWYKEPKKKLHIRGRVRKAKRRVQNSISEEKNHVDELETYSRSASSRTPSASSFRLPGSIGLDLHRSRPYRTDSLSLRAVHHSPPRAGAEDINHDKIEDVAHDRVINWLLSLPGQPTDAQAISQSYRSQSHLSPRSKKGRRRSFGAEGTSSQVQWPPEWGVNSAVNQGSSASTVPHSTYPEDPIHPRPPVHGLGGGTPGPGWANLSRPPTFSASSYEGENLSPRASISSRPSTTTTPPGGFPDSESLPPSSGYFSPSPYTPQGGSLSGGPFERTFFFCTPPAPMSEMPLYYQGDGPVHGTPSSFNTPIPSPCIPFYSIYPGQQQSSSYRSSNYREEWRSRPPPYSLTPPYPPSASFSLYPGQQSSYSGQGAGEGPYLYPQVALGPSSNLYSQNYPFVVHAHVAQRGNCMVQYVVSSRGF